VRWHRGSASRPHLTGERVREVITVERILTTALGRHVGERVRLSGWLHQQRRLSRTTFLVVRDGRGVAQVVVDAAGRAALGELAPETVLEVEGEVVATEQAPGGVELRDPSVRVLSASSGSPPVELRRPTLKEQLPTRLDHAAVALRHPRERARFAIAAASIAGYRAALDGLGFLEILTPKLVGSAIEGGANVFEVDYFGHPAYLAQSPQLYKQIMVGAFERVYECGPAFRAEPHDTARHLAEFTSLDLELGFIEDHRAVMHMAREAVAGMVDGVRSRASAAVELLGLALPTVTGAIPSVPFTEAQQLVEQGTGRRVVREPDLAPADERWLGEWARREHGSELLFVVGYPMAKRPFYTHPDPERPGFSNSFDLLFRGVELLTGGQRLHRFDDYLDALAARGLSAEPFEGYLEAFRYGMPPHGGFGMALERWVAQLTGVRNIREARLFPRDRTRLAP
jgi:nondiscriminating aspartyl-tRNA synthetase